MMGRAWWGFAWWVVSFVEVPLARGLVFWAQPPACVVGTWVGERGRSVSALFLQANRLVGGIKSGYNAFPENLTISMG